MLRVPERLALACIMQCIHVCGGWSSRVLHMQIWHLCVRRLYIMPQMMSIVRLRIATSYTMR